MQFPLFSSKKSYKPLHPLTFMKPRYSFSSRRTGQARDPKNYLKQKTKFPESAQKVLNYSDIILQVLDSRFIEDTRNIELEKFAKKNKKQILHILNKSDLAKIKENPPTPFVKVSCKKRTGIKLLRDTIKRIASKIKKEKINVGILGYPNTGKSSLINILIGKKSAGTGSQAGFTKGIQKLKLTENLMLLDSPGVIPKSEYSSIQNKKIAKHAKVGARTYAHVKNPEQIISELMKEYSKEIENHYQIKSNKNPETLLEELGKKRSFLKKGGVIDTDRASRLILKDWQEGKIKI